MLNNKKMFKKIFITGLFSAGLFVGATSTFADKVPVQLLGVNDFHGALSAKGSAYMPTGKVSGAGTATLLSYYLDAAKTNFKEANPNGVSIRVQAGDIVGASPANSALLQDEPTIRLFNLMGFEYGTLGNHEFDEGLAEFNRILTGQAPEKGKFYDIVENYPHEASDMKLVIGNVIDKDGNIPFGWEPYAIKEIEQNGKTAKVGFIGVVTTEIPSLVLRKNYIDYSFLDEAETIAKYSKELQAKGVNAIVVLAHVPALSDGDVAKDEAAKMIEKLNMLYPENSVDVVFAGHNHKYTNGLTGKTRIVQAVSQGKAYADVRGELDTDTQDFVSIPTATVNAVAPIDAHDPKVDALVEEADNLVKKVTDAKIGSSVSNEVISHRTNEFNESAAGGLITDAQLAIAKKSGFKADFAMTNDGGIRADLLVKEDGTITWGAAQAVQPFGNILQVVEMTGQQVLDVLNEQYDENQKYFLQISGLHYTYTDADNKTEEHPYKVYKVYKDDGSELKLDEKYTVIINDFLYGGGDSFGTFRKANLIGALDPDTEVFVQYIKDVEASGQKLDVKIKGTKKYLTAEEIAKLEAPEDSKTLTTASEESLSEDSKKDTTQKGNHCILTNKNCSKKSEDNKNITEPTTTQISTTMISENLSEKEKPQVVGTVARKTLPKTGEQTSLVVSILGVILVGLGSFTFAKKNKN